MFKKLLLMSALTGFLMSCKTTIQPMYVSTAELASLNVGMNKVDAKAKLGNLNPHDILMSEEGGCEVHQYKYKTPAKMILMARANTKDGLYDGNKKYVDESDAYLVYKNGMLESVLTNAGKADIHQLLTDISANRAVCNEVGLRGCMDPMSINYNPNAIIDNGSCKYCECGYELNPDFNPNRPVSDCNQQCVKLQKENSTDNQECTNCDLIDKLSKANANVNINFQLPDINQNGTRKQSNDSKEGGDAKTKDTPTNKKVASPSNNQPKTGKKLVKMN